MSAEEEVSQEVLDGVEAEGVDEELEAMKSKVKEMEDEAEKLRKIQEQVEDQLQDGEGEGGGEEGESAEADGRSVYVGQVDYSATPEELQEHFAGCGTVNRVTIICDKFGSPKGFAYIEFADAESVEPAVQLHDSEFKGRQLKVVAKRTNVFGYGGRGKGKGGKGAGKGKGKGKGKGMYDYGKGKGYKGYAPYFKPYAAAVGIDHTKSRLARRVGAPLSPRCVPSVLCDADERSKRRGLAGVSTSKRMCCAHVRSVASAL
eukprot:CAMPEP_0115865874 /NCGR_PEP_ID=MMETSP0287-20121206/19948_1 /TAXON_ID=412157 /ORGANISM="Chrysochromulina rotalis, Strain UIO044" /LENGTH=259 /DNA_ID=CAMNT_0003320403 /DNA_START=89 /DNA_END=869 /DNA_ORIENTATION=-